MRVGYRQILLHTGGRICPARVQCLRQVVGSVGGLVVMDDDVMAIAVKSTTDCGAEPDCTPCDEGPAAGGRLVFSAYDAKPA